MAKQKKDLEKENKELKDTIKMLYTKVQDLEKQLEVNEIESGSLTHVSLGACINEKGQYQLVEIDFNPNTKECANVKVFDPAKNVQDYAICLMAAKQYLVEKIMEPVRNDFLKRR